MTAAPAVCGRRWGDMGAKTAVLPRGKVRTCGEVLAPLPLVITAPATAVVVVVMVGVDDVGRPIRPL